MVIKFLLISIFVVSCGGREVKFNNNNLEANSQLTTAEVQSYLKTGSIRKNAGSTVVTYNNQNFTVSIYSSNNAQTFIATLPVGAQVPIKFTGGTSGQQIVLETVQRQ